MMFIIDHRWTSDDGDEELQQGKGKRRKSYLGQGDTYRAHQTNCMRIKVQRNVEISNDDEEDEDEYPRSYHVPKSKSGGVVTPHEPDS